MSDRTSTRASNTSAAGSESHGTSSPFTHLTRAANRPLNVVAPLLPTGPVPVALGTSALAIAGVIEWPVAAAVGLGYLALRRWHH